MGFKKKWQKKKQKLLAKGLSKKEIKAKKQAMKESFASNQQKTAEPASSNNGGFKKKWKKKKNKLLKKGFAKEQIAERRKQFRQKFGKGSAEDVTSQPEGEAQIIGDESGTDTYTPTDYTTQAEAPADVPSWMSEENLRKMFPNLYGGNQVDYESSDLYKWQKEQGQKRLDRLMASRGLVGSSGELAANRDLLNQLGAQEAERQSQVRQQEAQRLMDLLNTQADRERLQGNDQFSRALQVAQLGLGQSTINNAYGAAGNMADLTQGYGKNIAGITKGNYARPTVGYAGGGGGGGFNMPYIPPFPSGPDYSGANAVNAITSPSKTSNVLGGASKVINGISKIVNY